MSNWHDLRPRVITGVLLVAVGLAVIWAGGTVFAVTIALASGLMIWELARMIDPARATQAIQLGVLTAACLLLARYLGAIFVVPLLILPAVAGALLLQRHHLIWGAYALGLTLAGYSLGLFRDSHGLAWVIWLVLVVVATDIAGYFAGRIIGGPKFWPAVSPKKTWAGIVAGWIAAGGVGLAFALLTPAGPGLALLSALVSFASQMGDAAESAIKRRMGVKDSSHLLPGHGGLLDRFDALLGAALFVLLLSLVFDMPGLRF